MNEFVVGGRCSKFGGEYGQYVGGGNNGGGGGAVFDVDAAVVVDAIVPVLTIEDPVVTIVSVEELVPP